MEVLSVARLKILRADASQKGIIDTAEMLAAFLVELPRDKRPQLMVDADSTASFGTSVEDFYINLTIEAPGKLSWYAVVNDQEFFKDETAFNGRSMPQDLRDLFKLRKI